MAPLILMLILALIQYQAVLVVKTGSYMMEESWTYQVSPLQNMTTVKRILSLD